MYASVYMSTLLHWEALVLYVEYPYLLIVLYCIDAQGTREWTIKIKFTAFKTERLIT